MAAVTAATQIRVRVVDSERELEGLAAEWERLQQGAAVTSIFASFDWQHGWWRHYGHGQPLRLLLASDDGVLVGILPLYIQTASMLRFPVRMLRFVGTGGDTYPDDLGPVLAAAREDEVARALAQAVLELDGWDVLLLTDMQPESAFTSAMQVAASGARLRHDVGRSERIALMALPASWDAWLGSLHRDRRYRIRNLRKKLRAAHPDARFFVWSDGATLPDALARLAELHRRRWRRAGQAHAFSSPAYLAFHGEVMRRCFERDRLRLYALEVGGEIIAMYYFYRFRNRVFLMQSGFDPDHANLNPGHVLLGHIVESAIGEGHELLDFLRGDHRYKDDLATGERETVYLTAFRRRLGAWVYRARRTHLPAIKAQLVARLRRT